MTMKAPAGPPIRNRDPPSAETRKPPRLEVKSPCAGLAHEATLAVEGPGWLLPDLDARLADDRGRAVLLDALAVLEAEPSLLGASAHLLFVSRRS